ncbi:MAG: hypothetical protein ACYDHU_02820 [Acidimicrobiales bacterium]
MGAQAYGPGDWQLDFELNPLEPPPITTIAWRLGHLTSGIAGRWEWTFGSRRRPPEDLVAFTPSAAKALAEWWSWLFVGIVWRANQEIIHHLAEIALLGDLW